MVFNKIDSYKHEVIEDDDLITERTKAHYSLDDWKQTWMNNENGEAIFISALKKENIEEFKRIVYDKVKELHIERFPYNQFLYEDYTEED
jgi:GTP-binding protein HflX